MSNRMGLGLNFGKKLLLTSAAAVALVGPVVLGVVIATAHLPVLHAQVVVPQAPRTQPAQTTPQRSTVGASPDTANLRLLTLLFDCGAMNSEEQERARRAAIEFVLTRMQANDVMSVMQASAGKLAVVQDYTGNPALLQSAIAGVGAQGESSLESRLATLEQAARMLAPMPGKKSLIYFSPGAPNVEGYEAQLKRALQAAVDANVAFYSIDVHGAAPAGNTPGEQRMEEARARFGNTSGAMSRTYIRYGQPDQIEDRGSTQIWRYNYLQTFRGRAEFEFQPGNRPTGVRILWPPPTATFEAIATDGASFS